MSGYAAPRSATGVRTSRRLSPDGYPLWLVVADLDDGAELRWDAGHGDDGIYVASGELEVDGRRCPPGGAVIVESGVAATARAAGPTRVVHCGARDAAPPADGLYGPPAAGGHSVHVLGEGGWFRSGDRERVEARWYADSTCPTCRIALFRVVRPEGGVKDRSHTHTQDELIYVLDGSIVTGGAEHGPGSCVAIRGRHAVLAHERPGRLRHPQLPARRVGPGLPRRRTDRARGRAGPRRHRGRRLPVARVLISADSHVVEPPDLWTERLPSRLRDAAPRAVQDPVNHHWYLTGADGTRGVDLTLSRTAGMAPKAVDEILAADPTADVGARAGATRWRASPTCGATTPSPTSCTRPRG